MGLRQAACLVDQFRSKRARNAATPDNCRAGSLSGVLACVAAAVLVRVRTGSMAVSLAASRRCFIRAAKERML